jgi:cell wall-active antibiotic response 4TMS protein YvqF
MNGMSEGRRTSRLIGGILLLLLGGLFVLQNLGYVRAGNFGDYWPLLLVWVGLTRMLTRGSHVASGFVIFVLGVFFQLERLDVIWVPVRQFWPVLLIVIGFGLIADSLIARRGRSLERRYEARPGSRS